MNKTVTGYSKRQAPAPMPRFILKPMVIAIYHALQEVGQDWRERRQQELYERTRQLQKGAIIIDESGLLTQDQLDLMSKSVHIESA